jgi:basic amino acid/polyamine antiporter, APA family
LRSTVTGLRRQLGLLDAVMINVGTIIASAIFFVPSDIARTIPGAGPAVLVWVVGGAVSLLGALCVAELGAAMPQAGGMFVYLREAYGPLWAYLYGWGAGIVINPASIAAISVVCATYLGYFIPMSPGAIPWVAAGTTVVLTALNCLGVKPGTLTQNVLTALKIGLVLLLIVTGLLLPGGSVQNFHPVWPAGSPLALLPAFGVAMVSVLWAYDGWIEITYVGGEVKDPGRTMPRAIVLSTLIGMALYVAVTVAYQYVLPAAKIAASPLVASDAAQMTLGRAGAGLVAAAIVISTLGANNGIILTAARIPYAMAEDGQLFKFLGVVHPRFATPVASLLAQGAITVALTLSGKYQALYTYVVFVGWIFYALACSAVMRLRAKRPDLERPYRAWGYPFTPIVFIAFALWLVFNTIVQTPKESAIGAGLVLIGLPLFYYFRSRERSPATPG